ncbi:MAG: Gfo/Idh/MocA family oxidoreductase [Bacteroidales bacterium]|nr:Gfo/Idh/MocA family oxidoreductase [Bacteroidales bacterium]
MNRRYNWGIIGPGRIAEKFASDLQLLPNAKLYAVASRDISRATEFAKRYSADKAYGSYKELTQDPNVDIVYIATPHTRHYSNSLLCLENKKSVLCEKPVAINSRQCSIMVEKAKINNVFFMEAMWTRFLPSFIRLKELIDKKVIGDLLNIEADFGFRSSIDEKDRLFNPELGGGSLLDIGIYPVFLAYQLAGIPLKIRAFSTLSESGIDHSTTMMFEHEKKVNSALLSSIVTSTRTEAIIYGKEGVIKVRPRWFMVSDIELIKNGQAPEVFSFTQQGFGYQYEASEVMNCLDKGLIESEKYSWTNSVDIMSILDKVRSITGIRYPDYIENA